METGFLVTGGNPAEEVDIGPIRSSMNPASVESSININTDIKTYRWKNCIYNNQSQLSSYFQVT